MRITVEHFRAHGKQFYATSCTMRWFTRNGLDWRVFFKEGYPLEVMRTAAGDNDPDLNALLNYLREQGNDV